MRKWNTSSWVLIAVVGLAVGIGVLLLVFRPAAAPGFAEGRRPFAGRAFRGEPPAEALEEYSEKKLGDLTVGDLLAMRRQVLRSRHFHGLPGRLVPRAAGFGLGGILLVGGAVVVVVLLVRRRPSDGRNEGDSSLEILEQRFAEGKIGEEELKRKRAVLRDEEA